MCGIIGLVANYPINRLLVNSLNGLQHRGRQAAGIATLDGNFMHLKKGLGLIKDVISNYDLSYLSGNAGIGHVRFPTAGAADDPEQAHPFYVNSPFGIMLAHNGNLTNTANLRQEVFEHNQRHVRTQSDSEVLTNVFAFELQQLTANSNLTETKIFAAISKVQQRISGGYAVVSLIANYGLIAFRDPFGIRPLIMGQRREPDGFVTTMLASESCTLTINGFEIIRDIAPGEAIIITLDGKISTKICHSSPSLNLCIFEYAYLARPDSVMEQAPVQLVRHNLGNYLAATIRRMHPDLVIDVVIPVPEIARTTAIATANALNLPYREGFVRNHLIETEQAYTSSEELTKALINRLSPISLEFKHKNVLLVDVAVVRGDTSRAIIALARKAGANAIYFASATPKIQYSSTYGVDMPDANHLVGHGRSDAEVGAAIGADVMIYPQLSDLKQCIQELNPNLTQFEASCFDGNYLTTDIDQAYLASLTTRRNR